MATNKSNYVSQHGCTHECKHETVKYCPKCKKVYCTTCRQEWVDSPVYIYSSPTISTGTYPYYVSSTCIPWDTTTTNGDELICQSCH